MASALEKIKKQLEETRGRISRTRVAAKRHETEQVVMSAVGAYAVGMAESKGFKFPTIAGIDPKFILGAVALLGATRLRGTSQSVVLGLGQGALCAAAHAQGLGKGYVISGEPVFDSQELAGDADTVHVDDDEIESIEFDI